MKLSEIKDEIIYYIYECPQSWYRIMSHWWRCNGSNPWHWKLIWYTIFHHYSWDPSFMYYVLYYQINKAKYYFENKCTHLRKEAIDYKVKWMNLAISLLEIILNKRELFDMVKTGETTFEKIEGSDNYQMTNFGYEYKCLVKVNTKNRNRFKIHSIDVNTNKVFDANTDWYLQCPDELYKEKATRLLLQIMQNYAHQWWD